MKFVVGLALFGGWNSFSQAAPVLPEPRSDVYLVYSGTATQAQFSGGTTSAATVTKTKTIYVILDLSNVSCYSVLVVNSDKSYNVSSRILSADGTSLTAIDDGVASSDHNPARNFINGIENNATSDTTSPTKGYAVFRFNLSGTETVPVGNNETHDYPNFTEVYATGLVAGLSNTVPVTLVAADTKAKVSGVYTINPIVPAITNYLGVPGNASTDSYPASLAGVLFSYGYDSTLVETQSPPPLDYLSVSGTVSLTLNPTLTSLANVGGSYKLKGQLAATSINAVAGTLTSTSSSTVYEDFLYSIVQSLGLPAGGYVPTP